MNSTRRLFLQGAALSVIAANLPSAFAQEQLKGRNISFDPESLTLLNGVSSQTFEPWIGSSFSVSLNNKSSGSLVLLSVNNLKPEARDVAPGPNGLVPRHPVPKPSFEEAVVSFSLKFRRIGEPLPQNTYILSHDWLGTFPLFLVPSGLPGPRSTCTAVFSLLNSTVNN